MPARVSLQATAFTHRGALRPRNEDTIAVGDWMTSESMAEPQSFELAVGVPTLCLVADGMGGHAAGDVASRTVAEYIVQHAGEATVEATIAALLVDANAELFALMDEQPAWRGMGATVAGIAANPAGVIVFNIGDSRVYRIDRGVLTQLSTDDTPGEKLSDGRTAMHTSSVITQALGGHGGEEMAPHLLNEPLAPEARYLICSDGLTDLLDVPTIAMQLAEDDGDTIEALFDAAMERGGDDNVSIIIARVRALS
jgi:serine/threonine protein phosphatase PrpC